MPLSWNEIRVRSVAFVREWESESSESAEAKSFWDAFFHVFGITRRRVAAFEQHVKKADGNKQNPATAPISYQLQASDYLLHVLRTDALKGFTMANNWNIPEWLEKEVRERDTVCVYCGGEFTLGRLDFVSRLHYRQSIAASLIISFQA
jgi:hypothetical protein